MGIKCGSVRCIPWDNTFQLVTVKFKETEAHFCLMLLCGEKMGLVTKRISQLAVPGDDPFFTHNFTVMIADF